MGSYSECKVTHCRINAVNVCYKLGAHQLEITEVRKDMGTSQSKRMSVSCQSVVSRKYHKQCLQGTKEVETLKGLMLLHKAVVSPHLEHGLKCRERESKWRMQREELLL